MVFRPPDKQPDIENLEISLVNSKLQQKNPALFDTIRGLIQRVRQFQGLVVNDITSINESIAALTNVVNNINIAAVVTNPVAIMPVIEGMDGEEGFIIPGPRGRDGLDGKTIFFPNEYDEPIESAPLFPQPYSEQASEVTFTTTGNIDDLDFSNSKLIRMNNATSATIRGLKAGRAGQIVTIVSIGAGNVFLANQDGGSAAANRLTNFATSANTPLAAGKGTCIYEYDATTAAWRLVSHIQGAFVSQTFAAGDFTASGAMTWTVAVGDVATNAYYLEGKKLTVQQILNQTTVGGVVSTELRALIPGGFTCDLSTGAIIRVNDNGVVQVGRMLIDTGLTYVSYRPAVTGGNWTLATDATSINGQLITQVT